MKKIFYRPIGTVRDLGTRKEWLCDALALFALGFAILIAWIAG